MNGQSLLFLIHAEFPKQQISDCSKQKEFADDNFEFDGNCGRFSKRGQKHQNGRKLSKRGRKHCGKRKITHYKEDRFLW